VTKPLTLKALNRATLARQLLLEREKTTAVEAVERLAGMQAQVAWPPFVGLWSRVARFQREELLKALQKREVLRATLMRGTLHLMSAKDYAALRPSLQSALTRGMHTILRGRAKGIDVPKLSRAARAFFARSPAGFDAVRDHLAQEFPKLDVRAMGYAVRLHVPLLQVPDASRWGYPQAADFALVDDEPDGDAAPHELIRRYLAAFGPATVGDAQAWSGLQGLKPVFDALRDELIVLEDERGRELFDLKKSPRPGEDVDAPVRLVPDFDNLVLAHDDRSRIVADAHRKALVTKNLLVAATFLVDGFVAGTWKVERKGKVSTLKLSPFGNVPARARKALELEAEACLAFMELEGQRCAVAWSR
jgi:hypothetical protein